jgi:transposase
LAPGQRWSLARKRDVVLQLMQGEPVEALSRKGRLHMELLRP